MNPAVVLALIAGASIGFVVSRLIAARSPATVESPAPASVDEVPSLLTSAVDHLEIGVVVANLSGRIVYRNSAARAFEGTHIGVLVDDQISSSITDSWMKSLIVRPPGLGSLPDGKCRPDFSQEQAR